MKRPLSNSLSTAGIEVVTIPVRSDNYAYLMISGEETVVIDPGDTRLVRDYLQTRGLNPVIILNTHHHIDHVAGNQELKRKFCCEVIASSGGIPGVDRTVGDGEEVLVGGVPIRVISTPGHGRRDVSYYVAGEGEAQPGVVWTGDTLFVGGCGRLFEEGPEVMWASLQRLTELPDETLVYCGHEYTVENFEFAASIEPENKAIIDQLDAVRRKRRSGEFTVPSTIGREKALNPFLRADTLEMRKILHMEDASAEEVFGALRRMKDVF